MTTRRVLIGLAVATILAAVGWALIALVGTILGQGAS